MFNYSLINAVDNRRIYATDILNQLSTMEGSKVDQVIEEIMRLMQSGTRYSNEDFDILSYGWALTGWVA